ncbi:MAG: hypothetical protein Q9191_006737, partial [Dirinaria sp. TL-2023a]
MQTFRRPSLANTSSQQRDGLQSNNNPPSSSGVYVPPHMNSHYQSSHGRNGASTEGRYSKDQLLDLYRAQGQSGPDVAELFVEGWSPNAVNGISHGGWGKRDDHKEQQSHGAEICWDHEGTVQPLSLIEMNDEEKQAFQTSVNSPLKPPTQTSTKDGTPGSNAPGRRTSLSQTQRLSYSENSPSSRPGNRRRDSADLLQGSLTSPIGSNRFSREEPNVSSPPPSLLRRRTDLRDNALGATQEDHESESKPAAPQDAHSPFGALKRTATGPANAGLNGPSSPWSNGPQSAGFTPMGAFGNFSLGGQSGQPLTPNDKKTSFGSLRGESRFKGLMNTESSEEARSNVREKTSMSSLERLAESANEQPSRWGHLSSAHLQGEEDGRRTGSAALGGDDVGPPQHVPSRRNPDASLDEIGFSSLGMPSEVAPFRDLMQRRDQGQQMPQNYGGGLPNEPMSPTDTNPYRSPETEKAMPGDIDTDESEPYNMQFPGVAPYGRGMQSHVENPSTDRSRTSSAGASRGFPNLGNLGGSGAQGPWSAAPGAIGTPSRAQAPFSNFGDSMPGSLGEFNAPGYGGSRFFDSGAGPIGRASKMGSLFPNAMQDQMRGESSRAEQGFADSADPQRQMAASNAPGFGRGLRETDSPSHAGRLENMIWNLDVRDRNPQTVSSSFASNEAAANQAQPTASSQQPFTAAIGTPSIPAQASSSYFGRPKESDSSAMPASQQRQMVMPDRMRWIYRDPEGNTQGPWSGLEMHDWYKAGFFSPELQVKKQEDADYEPLAQLIRRIGNSREPFLVPQIGIPHGSSTQASATPAAGVQTVTTPSAQSSSAQPPFASSFPSFGTTLTAEQQNALERRKQEEQYLMARQKEHLAQQQVMIKQMQHMQGGPGQQLHHHSSAHSLQSQPSYGSITSPTGYQPSPAQAPIRPPAAGPGFFESSLPRASAEALSPVREDEMPGFMDRMNAGRPSHMPPGGPQYGAAHQEGMSHPQQMANMLQERARLQREQEQYDMLQRGAEDHRGQERLDQFHMLRSQLGDQQPYTQGPEGQYAQPQMGLDRPQQRQEEIAQGPLGTEGHSHKPSEPLSLSEQVQKAAAMQSPAQPISPWAKVDPALPQPFPAPPPQPSSPLPAPAAQRRQNVADTLTMESRSRSQTPSVDTPSATVAPWAKGSEPAESAKGPSLKEIQAMEARKAAQQEEIAAAARRAVAEQERANQSQQAAPAPGLPSSANWASGPGVSPAVPTAGAWAKSKPAVATPTAGKKTLAQIQKEEEARKMRAAAASSAAGTTNAAAPVASVGGKRYADLASKAAPNAGPQASSGTSNSAWTTVGAGGKVKTPTTPAAPVSGPRTASTGSVPASMPAKATPKAAAAAGAKEKAQEEFVKWIKSSLGKQLHGGISVDTFTSSLLSLPPEPDIISDSIYVNSQTLDGRHFAQEFVRRRNLADKGQLPPDVNGPGGSSSAGGAAG